MGIQILIYPNNWVIYKNTELDTNKFINYINELVNCGYSLTFYEELSGFSIRNCKTT